MKKRKQEQMVEFWEGKIRETEKALQEIAVKLEKYRGHRKLNTIGKSYYRAKVRLEEYEKKRDEAMEK